MTRMLMITFRSRLYYALLMMLALSIAGLLSFHFRVTPALACEGTLVLVDGHIECQVSGSHPGGSEGGSGTGGGGGNPGTPGDGGNGNNKNNNGNNGTDAACTPGSHESNIIVSYEPSAGTCEVLPVLVDNCTGSMLDTMADDSSVVPCEGQTPPAPPSPCDKFIVNGGGITCTTDFETSRTFPGSQWQLTVRTPWPGAEIHTRPYPVTLVNWDTVMRVAGLGSSSNSGQLSYAAWGGGNEDDPAAGDWKALTLRLEIRPVADWVDVFLENIGLIRMHVGELHTFQWNVPSHPAAGGGPLSGQVGQLEELQPDVPLFTNWTRAPYMVYCTISYYEWEGSCRNGPAEDGSTNCRKNAAGVFTGHREWGWKRHSQTIAITPEMAANQIPVNQLADLNGDGVFDAYWGRLSFIRRMDDAGRVDNPDWAHSYSWGPVWYWAVREGQGQVGWPGVPLK